MAKTYGRKIKRSRNLYKKRKSTGRKALETLAMAVLIGGLGLIGFAVGKPLIDFFTAERVADSTLQWSPPEDEPVVSEDGGTAEGTTENEPAIVEPVIKNDIKYGAVSAPASVLSNSTSLAAYIQQVKADGYNAVVLEMKDGTGNLYYASGYEPLKNTEIIKGTLTAAQIYGAFKDTGITPMARINTALDQLGPKYIDGVSYFFADGSTRWADNRIENGGKLWANPFLKGTRDYNSYLVGELAEAGFTEIILANTLFPDFKPYDFSVLNTEYTNKNTRYAGLTGFIKECAVKKGQARLILEMSVRDVVENYSGFNGSAELLKGKKDLSDFALLLVYSKGDFGDELKTGESSSVILPKDTDALINMLYKQAENQAGGLYIIPCLAASGLTDSEKAEILSAYDKLGYDGRVIR